jgi:hypothetical protein
MDRSAKNEPVTWLLTQICLTIKIRPNYTAQFVAELRRNGIKNKKLFDILFSKEWVIYSKKPFGNAHSVVEYLGRYTHKIAITKHRIVSLTDKEVRFRCKDYTDGDKQKVISLTRQEFLRRFELHFLPVYFTKIRNYGFIQNNSKRKHLIHIRELLKLSPLREVVINSCSAKNTGKIWKRYYALSVL